MIQKIISFFNNIDDRTKFTVFISILTFSLGFIINEIIKKISKNREKRSYKKSLFFLINGFSNSCLKQTKALAKSIESVGLLNDADFQISRVTINSLHYLIGIDLQKFVSTIDRKNKHPLHDKALNKLILIISEINENNNDSKDFLLKMATSFKEHEDIYQKAINSLRDIYDDFYVQNKNNQIPVDQMAFANSYGLIFENYFEKRQSLAFYASYVHIIAEVLTTCRNHANQKSIDTIKFALSADLAFENLKKIEKGLKENFQHSIFMHRRAYKLIPIIIKILKLKLPPFYSFFYNFSLKRALKK